MTKKSPIEKHSIILNGHKTSTSLEKVFWDAIGRMANDAKRGINEFIADIDTDRRETDASLASALRVYVAERLLQRVASLEGTAQAAE